MDFQFIEMVLRECTANLVIDRASDGEAAQTYLLNASSLPDLILLDINLPKVNGFEVLQSVKADLRTREVPVVIFTSSANNREREQALMLGATEFLTKPNDLTKLLQVLDSISAKYLTTNRTV